VRSRLWKPPAGADPAAALFVAVPEQVAVPEALSAPEPAAPAEPRADLYAALDLGTNNCRLLVARPGPGGFRIVDSFSRIVRLGEGLGLGNRLADGAMRRTLDALATCADRLNDRDVRRRRLIATEACRAAENGPEFLADVSRITGLDLEIIDRRTEAELAAAGCAVLMARSAESAILFDIGGGSTEVVWLAAGGEAIPIRARIRAWTSLPVGVVTLAERHGGHDVTPELYRRMVDEVRGLLAPFRKDVDPRRLGTRFHLLGTSGTVTTIAALHLGLDRYDRRQVDGLWMSTGEAAVVIGGLMRMSHAERAANACIGRERADLVLAGCAIYDALAELFPTGRIRIADRGLREGILMQLMMEDGVWRSGREAVA
jgi:exopolyphosphatase / guanosine-5'-triphosphate,3'-diphosphate pyrophosphatase